MAVTFDAIGSGNSSTAPFNGSIAASWTHNPVGVPALALVGLTHRAGGQTTASQGRVITWGGTSMTQLATADVNSETHTDVYGLLTPGSGAKTVSVTVGNGTNTGHSMVTSSATFLGVTSVDTAGKVITTGSSTAPSATLTTAGASDMVFNVIGCLSGTQSGYSQTSRFNANAGDNYSSLLIGDATGGSSLTFSDTLSLSANWADIAIRLVGAATTPTNLFFEMF